MPEISIRPSELRGVREAMRTMPQLVRALNEGEVAKYVLMKRGRVVAVLLDIEDYADMVQKAKVRDAQSHIPDARLHREAKGSDDDSALD